jgi:hypothetical protein
VPISADLLSVLKAHLGSHCMEQVFWHGKDKAEAYKDVKKSFKRALAKAGIAAFRFHDCRHYAESGIMPNRPDDSLCPYRVRSDLTFQNSA